MPGGWANRDTVSHFCDYAQAVLDGLGDAVPQWATINEPFCSAMIGHLEGRHAPGIVDLGSALAASHHLLLAHGQAVGIVRRSAPGARVGITHLLSDISAASESEADEAAARRLDGYENRWFLDPVLRGTYPGGHARLVRAAGADRLHPRRRPAGDRGADRFPGRQLLRDQDRGRRPG